MNRKHACNAGLPTDNERDRSRPTPGFSCVDSDRSAGNRCYSVPRGSVHPHIRIKASEPRSLASLSFVAHCPWQNLCPRKSLGTKPSPNQFDRRNGSSLNASEAQLRRAHGLGESAPRQRSQVSVRRQCQSGPWIDQAIGWLTASHHFKTRILVSGQSPPGRATQKNKRVPVCWPEL